ncbi:hypothetical protein AVEN_130564-1 [Araneus ventricosus]|uniref:Uncharacterized protein n=1 Tax=Araneus ventricosus TaxID=182803 RepID=A0A4Y2UYS0_ARAVE|nr:hypothetical protein AVEN_130564-1 [Araneus ventricosus]
MIAFFGVLKPGRSPCDFWLWGCLKPVVFSGPISDLAALKAHIGQYIHNTNTDTRRFVIEHAISRFEHVAENGGGHIEHFLNKYRGSLILI